MSEFSITKESYSLTCPNCGNKRIKQLELYETKECPKYLCNRCDSLFVTKKKSGQINEDIALILKTGGRK